MKPPPEEIGYIIAHARAKRRGTGIVANKQRKAYATCKQHAGEALAHMAGEVVKVVDVSGHDRGPSSALYTCSCGAPAVFHLTTSFD